MPRGSRSNGGLTRRAQRLHCCFIQHITVRQRNSRLLFREVSHESLAFSADYIPGPAGAERLHADARQRPRAATHSSGTLAERLSYAIGLNVQGSQPMVEG